MGVEEGGGDFIGEFKCRGYRGILGRGAHWVKEFLIFGVFFLSFLCTV